MLLYACVAILHLIFVSRTVSLMQVLCSSPLSISNNPAKKIIFQPKSAQTSRKLRASFKSKVDPLSMSPGQKHKHAHGPSMCKWVCTKESVVSDKKTRILLVYTLGLQKNEREYRAQKTCANNNSNGTVVAQDMRKVRPRPAQEPLLAIHPKYSSLFNHIEGKVYRVYRKPWLLIPF